MMVTVPINMTGDAYLIAKRVELEEKMNTQGKLTGFEATLLDSIVTEQNVRMGVYNGYGYNWQRV